MADELGRRPRRLRTGFEHAALAFGSVLVVVAANALGLRAWLDRNPHGLAVEVLALLLVVALTVSGRTARMRRRDLAQQRIVSEQLHETEGRFRNLIENIPAVTHVSGLDDTASTIYISPQVEEMLGFSPEEWRRDADLWVKLLHPEDREQVMANNAYHVVTGSPFVAEYRMVARDGGIVWVREDAAVIRDPLGQPKFSQGVWLDITERKRAEEELRDSEERYRRLVEHSPDAILVHSEGRFVYANPAAAALLGAEDPSALLGLPILSIVHPDYHDMVRQRVAEEAHGSAVALAHEKFVRLDGREIEVEVAGIPFTHEGKRGGQIVVRNITERTLAEERLLKAETRFRTLVEQIPAVTYLWEVTPEPGAPNVDYTSPQIEAMLGFTPEEWHARPDFWISRLHPEDRQRVVDATIEAERTGEESELEYRFIAKDGRVVWVRDYAVLMERDDLGWPRFFQGVMFDITEHKRAEEERARLLSRLVAAQEEERRRIAGDIHDDSVQKMAAVGLRLEALKRQLTEEGQLETLAQLQRSVALSVARLRHLLFELRPTALDAEGLGAALRQYLDQAAADWDLTYTLENEIGAEPPSQVRTIAYRIAQEALTNVRKHARAGSVGIALHQLDGGVKVRITDDGEGFDVAEADRARPGHLGFSAMRERAELVGGWWTVASAPGAGTTVEFWLPTGDHER